MHFFWDNLGRKDIIGSLSSDIFEPRTSTGSELKLLWRYLNCITKSLYPYRDDLRKHLFKITAQECKSPRPVDVCHSTTSQLKLPRNGIDGRTDGRMGRLIPNLFRVVQILLDIAVKVSLKDYWHLPKEVDYSLTLLVFVLGQNLILFMVICILNHPVIQRWSYIFFHFPPC